MKGEMERKARDIARFSGAGDKPEGKPIVGAAAPGEGKGNGGGTDGASESDGTTESKASAAALADLVPSSTAILVAEAPWSAFVQWQDDRVKKRGAQYEAKKALLQDHLMSALLAVRPDLRDRIEHVTMASPASNVHYLYAPHGASYGLDHDVSRFTECRESLHPDTGVPGLYLTGQDVCSVGVAGAAMGGFFAAAAASPWALITHADVLL